MINKIFELQSGIASAVEQQSVTVMEIGERVQSAAERSAEIASNIDDVAKASADTTSGARETEESAADMSMMSNELASLVGQEVARLQVAVHDGSGMQIPHAAQQLIK